MNYFVVELKSERGRGPWTTVNVIKAHDGRLAIDLANGILVHMFGTAISQRFHRVRRVDYEEFLWVARAILGEFDENGQGLAQFDRLDAFNGPSMALIQPS